MPTFDDDLYLKVTQRCKTEGSDIQQDIDCTHPRRGWVYKMGVMVELHKINIDHDARGVDMMHAGIDGVGVREMDMRFE
jgi:hypothetical protein